MKRESCAQKAIANERNVSAQWRRDNENIIENINGENSEMKVK
jgi:hypothetical protein